MYQLRHLFFTTWNKVASVVSYSCRDSVLAPVLLTLRKIDFHFRNSFEDFFFCNIFLLEWLLSTREYSHFTIMKSILRRKNKHKSCNHGNEKLKLKLGLSKLNKTCLKNHRTGGFFWHCEELLLLQKLNKSYIEARRCTFVLFFPAGMKLQNHFANLSVSCSYLLSKTVPCQPNVHQMRLNSL